MPVICIEMVILPSSTFTKAQTEFENFVEFSENVWQHESLVSHYPGKCTIYLPMAVS